MSKRSAVLERLIGGTRQEVLELLLRADRTVQDVANEVGVSTNAIRGHLAALERDGLVAQRGTKRDTGGKPATLYGLTEEAVELFPKAYAFVLEGLLAVLDDRIGAAQVRRALTEVGKRAAVPARGSSRQRVQAAAEALRGLGATLEVHERDGRWRIQGFSCPLSSITQEGESRVCGLAQALVERTTGGTVLEACDRAFPARCAFEIEIPDSEET